MLNFFSRLCTHDVEGFFGLIHLLSNFNYSFDNTLNAVVKSILLRKYSEELNFQNNIRTREKEGGAVVTKEVLIKNALMRILLISLILYSYCSDL